jgi:hypothetical protein
VVTTACRPVNEHAGDLCSSAWFPTTQDVLRVEDVGAGPAAVEQLIDLACEMREVDYFRSEDPIEAARFVVSDAAALLWRQVRERCGCAGFAQRAAPQLIRWESRYGWTRSGCGRISEEETTLAMVLARMLPAPDMWACFADRYLDALDQVGRDDTSRPNRAWRPTDSNREQLGFLQAQLAYRRGDVGSARILMHEVLQKLPGHPSFLDFANEIGAPLPPRAERIAKERPRRLATT